MNDSVKYRHEFKYQCSFAQLSVLKARLHNLIPYDRHAENGQYTIRSMYFDSYNNRCYRENEDGTDPREKFRIRIYNANPDRISLECKRKERDKTHKTSCLLSRNQFEAIMAHESLGPLANCSNVLRKFVLLIATEQFRPSVIVEYDRTPLIYRDGNVRITFDQHIRSSSSFSEFFTEHIPTRPILPPGQHLMEVKYDEYLPGFIKECLETSELQRTTFSKFYLCKKYSLGGNI